MKNITWINLDGLDIPQDIHLSSGAYDALLHAKYSIAQVQQLIDTIADYPALYGNCVTKSEHFCDMLYNPQDQTIKGEKRMSTGWLKSKIGGDCVSLNFEAYQQLIANWIPGLPMGIVAVAKGTSRHFFINYPHYIHRFLTLQLGSIELIIDASLGEISTLPESDYQVKQYIPYTQDYLNQSSAHTNRVGQIDTNLPLEQQIISPGQMITLGLASNHQHIYNYSFAKTTNDTIIPVITTLEKSGDTIYSFYDTTIDTYQHLGPAKATLDQDCKQEISTILANISKVSIHRISDG